MKRQKGNKEQENLATMEDIQRNISLFQLNTGQKYNGAEEYAQQFKRCSVLQDTEIVYAQNSCVCEMK